MPALATGGDYKVLLVQPEDQDWDANLVARQPGNLIDIEMVRVKSGQEERFRRLRNEYKVRSRSSNNVVDVQLFKVERAMNCINATPSKNLFFTRRKGQKRP